MRLIAYMIACFCLSGSFAVADDLPETIAASGLKAIVTVHAEGTQVYDCKKSVDGKTTWQFREPVAALFEEGRNVGTHFAGPSWKIGESTIKGKVISKAPGASDKDVPWLKLDVVAKSSAGPLVGVTTVQRIHTVGGNLVGECARAGDRREVPYTADYVFLKP
jgi:Protein of unknown function (DUF3455)